MHRVSSVATALAQKIEFVILLSERFAQFVYPEQHARVHALERTGGKDDDVTTGIRRLRPGPDPRNQMPPALAAFDDAFAHEPFERGAKGHAADAQLRAQFAFAGQPLAHRT